MKKLLFFTLVIIAILFASCERHSHSGRLALEKEKVELQQPKPAPTTVTQKTYDNNYEKVVVIDRDGLTSEIIEGVFYYHYKVKRLELGVSDYAFSPNAFEKNDTILINKKFIR